MRQFKNALGPSSALQGAANRGKETTTLQPVDLACPLAGQTMPWTSRALALLISWLIQAPRMPNPILNCYTQLRSSLPQPKHHQWSNISSRTVGSIIRLQDPVLPILMLSWIWPHPLGSSSPWSPLEPASAYQWASTSPGFFSQLSHDLVPPTVIQKPLHKAGLGSLILYFSSHEWIILTLFIIINQVYELFS